MNLGFFTMPIHPLDKDWRQSLREDREAFILADQLGYTEGYVGEHHTDRAENITSCAMFICTLVDATKRIKLFRPDACEHSVTPVVGGSRYVFSLGWVLGRSAG